MFRECAPRGESPDILSGILWRIVIWRSRFLLVGCCFVDSVAHAVSVHRSPTKGLLHDSHFLAKILRANKANVAAGHLVSNKSTRHGHHNAAQVHPGDRTLEKQPSAIRLFGFWNSNTVVHLSRD
jgi:hypothetical protein